jgi:transcriptional regulator with XRE-family HTH domain
METFGEWLRAEMLQQGMNQSQLARKAGVSRSTVKRIIDGERGIGRASLGRLARALDLPPEELLRRAGYLSVERVSATDTTLARLWVVLTELSDEDVEELLYIALGKRDRGRK